MYVSTQIVKFWNFSRRFLVLNTFTFDSEEYCLDVKGYLR